MCVLSCPHPLASPGLSCREEGLITCCILACSALANHPSLLLLDEPTGDLDSKNTDIVLKLLLDLNGTVMPAVPSSHSQNKRGCV